MKVEFGKVLIINKLELVKSELTISDAIHDLVQNLTPQYGEGEARSIARLVFEDYFNLKSMSENDEMLFQSFLKEDYESIKAQILRGLPVQYVLGFAWFYGIKFKVNNSVLIPRPETEELVEWVLETINALKNIENPLKIIDIGTGSGCIPIILKIKNPSLEVTAIDVSESALITASRNAARHNVSVDFKRIDILNENDWIPLSHFDIIISNPPYIPHAEKALMEDNVLSHEPHLALFVDDDNPLVFYEKIANFAIKHGSFPLKTNAQRLLFFECNEFNAHEVVSMLHKKGFENIELKKDMSGKDRMIKAVWK